MVTQKMYNLFISHAWTYNEDYDRLVQMLDNSANLKVMIHSAYKYDTLNPDRQEDKERLLKLLEKQILPAGCILVLVQMYTGYREWLQAVCDIATRYEKPIIGIKPLSDSPVPVEMEGIFTAMVKWNKDAIVDVIRLLSE